MGLVRRFEHVRSDIAFVQSGAEFHAEEGPRAVPRDADVMGLLHVADHLSVGVQRGLVDAESFIVYHDGHAPADFLAPFLDCILDGRHIGSRSDMHSFEIEKQDVP